MTTEPITPQSEKSLSGHPQDENQIITERRAINLDPNCGWAQGKADVLYVADAFQVMTRVTALLGNRGR